MKSKIKNSVITTLVVSGLLLTASQSVLAKRPVTPSPDPAIVIDAVVVDFSAGEIEVTGSGLDAVTDVGLGGAVVSIDATPQSPNSLVINFSAVSAAAVQRSGNYSLALNGTSMSVYFSSAVFFDAGGATCPCQSTWEYYRIPNATYPIGFNGLTPISSSDSGDRVEVIFHTVDGFLDYFWFLNSEFSDTFQQCDMPIDGELFGLPLEINAAEHAACSTYLNGLF